MPEKARRGEVTLALTADVTEPHRQIMFDTRGRLESPQPYTGHEKRLHSEDSSGISQGPLPPRGSWSRTDFHLEAGVRTGDRLSLFSSPCARPQKLCLSWTKTAGSDVVGIEGPYIALTSSVFQKGGPNGSSGWTRGIAMERDINLSHFDKGICRLMYVAGDCESLHPRGSVRRVPPYVQLFCN